MLMFTFHFVYGGRQYEAACQSFSLDGITDLHITPRDPQLFGRFDVRILMRSADGSISTELPPKADERDYLLALAEGLSAYFDDQQKRISR